MLYNIYGWNGYLATQSTFANIFSTSAGSRIHTRIVLTHYKQKIQLATSLLETVQSLIQWVYGLFPRSKVPETYSWPQILFIVELKDE
jgi:hypothetical protein